MRTNGVKDHLAASTNEFTIHDELKEWPHFLLDFSAIRSSKAIYEITLSDRIKFKAFSSRREGHITRTVVGVESELRHIPKLSLLFDSIPRFKDLATRRLKWYLQLKMFGGLYLSSHAQISFLRSNKSFAETLQRFYNKVCYPNFTLFLQKWNANSTVNKRINCFCCFIKCNKYTQ